MEVNAAQRPCIREYESAAASEQQQHARSGGEHPRVGQNGQIPGHAKMNPQHSNAATARSINQNILGAAENAINAPPAKRQFHVSSVLRPGDCRSQDGSAEDGLSLHARPDATADRFHFGELRHG
jgi:hypothetical protein